MARRNAQQRGMDLTRIAEIVVQVMAQLGYERFGARGSDLGAGVLQQLALNHPERLIAVHLSGTNPYLGWIPDDLSPAEQEFVTNAQQWNQTEMAYAQRTLLEAADPGPRPQRLPSGARRPDLGEVPPMVRLPRRPRLRIRP
jgi:pimeloyl-ACP methyl ester carboxylesterase